MATKTNHSMTLRDDGEGAVAVAYLGQSAFVSSFITIVVGLPIFGCIILAARAVVDAQFDLAVTFLAIAASLIWLVWHYGWRKKPYEIVFDVTGVRSGPNAFDYAEIFAFSVGFNGGSRFDPTARNMTPGYHVAVKARGQVIPITVTLDEGTARAVRDACESVFTRFAQNALRS
ncbi:hypothetical protein AN191_06485 [Loktanella sp. 5RATIMAR09]|nr:hypothetical protein AN191_06485 [Loktanella sp. 5RATIMAR09]